MIRDTKSNLAGNEYFTGNTVFALLTVIISVLAFIASMMGIFNQAIYKELLLTGAMTEFLVYGSIIQDLISVPASILLFIFSIVFIKKHNRRLLIVLLGLTAYFFYGYGLYTIQGQYTSIYFIYLGIFGLSLYGLIFGILRLTSDVNQASLPKSLRYSIGVFLAMILLVLVPAWIARMMPDVIARTPGEVYGVFVLDLSIVFPALAIIAFKVMRGNSNGYLLAGVALIKVVALCLSVALGEWLKPLYGFGQDWNMIIIFSILTFISAVLSILFFIKIKLTNELV